MEVDTVKPGATDEVTTRVVVRGLVQGVGFRWWSAAAARDLGLAGWVRNRRDGTVEAVFRGPRTRVEDMLAACHRGPPSARVDRIEASDAAPEEAGQGGFEQRETV